MERERGVPGGGKAAASLRRTLTSHRKATPRRLASARSPSSRFRSDACSTMGRGREIFVNIYTVLTERKSRYCNSLQ